MQSIRQEVAEMGREVGRVGSEFIARGGHGMDAMDIVWLVLGVVLWAAVMATLVMTMIALVRHLKKPKGESSSQDETPDGSDKTDV